MNMNAIKCQVVNHNGKKIIAVCMDRDCKQKRLCCMVCISEFHGKHPNLIVEIEDLNSFIEQESNKQTKYTNSFGQAQIIQGLEQLNMIIDSIQKKIQEEIQRIKSQPMSLQEYLKKKNTIQQGTQNWNEFLEGILQYVEIKNCQLSEAKFKEGQLSQIEEQYIKNIKEFEQSLQRIIQRMNNPIELIGKLRFKDNRKHPDIAIIDNCTLKKTKSVTYSIAFADEGFDPSQENYQFAFNVQVKAQGVAVGVGSDEGGKVPSYVWDDLKLEHGLYMISQNNYTLHHTDGEINNKPQGMTFKVGDKIQIRYDHLTKILEFRNQSDQTIVKMPITDMSQRLYPCAVLCFRDDQVQLVEY